MSYTCGRNFNVTPDEVFPTIETTLLRDGFDIIIDMEKSKGSHIVNLKDGSEWLDFYTFFASAPFGMNHPMLHRRVQGTNLQSRHQ